MSAPRCLDCGRVDDLAAVRALVNRRRLKKAREMQRLWKEAVERGQSRIIAYQLAGWDEAVRTIFGALEREK